MFKKSATWISDQVNHVSGGRIRIGGGQEDLVRSPPRGAGPTSYVMDGTEEGVDDGVELEDR